MTKLLQFQKSLKVESTGENDETYQKVENDIKFFFSLLDMLGLEAITEGRYSTSFLMGLLNIHMQDKSIQPVIDEIKALEAPEVFESRTKPATQFTRSPLKGLWHKHFFVGDISSLAHNLLNSLNTQGGMEKVINEVCDASGESVLSEKIVNDLVKAVVSDSFKMRSEAQELTGEWIVYHELDGKKYYLAVAGHQFGDENIANNIKQLVEFEYPNFKGTLELFSD